MSERGELFEGARVLVKRDSRLEVVVVNPKQFVLPWKGTVKGFGPTVAGYQTVNVLLDGADDVRSFTFWRLDLLSIVDQLASFDG